MLISCASVIITKSCFPDTGFCAHPARISARQATNSDECSLFMGVVPQKKKAANAAFDLDS
jgi:hypothetical protein